MTLALMGAPAAAQGGQQLTPEQRADPQALQAQRREEAVRDRQRMMGSSWRRWEPIPCTVCSGRDGLGAATMPAPDVSLVSGALAFRNQEGGHADAPDWPVFLEFARRHFQR